LVQGNATLLEHVLCTLLDNAIKFVNPGTRPFIQIWTEQRDGNVRLCVRDNGIGIEPQYHERIFRPFERLHSPQAYEGTGIGLAIVKEGMKRMNGQAGVQSAPGQGSLFWLEFSRAEEIHEQRFRSPGLRQSMSVV
jgi:signal transduction histidine kinase